MAVGYIDRNTGEQCTKRKKRNCRTIHMAHLHGIRQLTMKRRHGRDETYFFILDPTLLFQFVLLYTCIAFIQNYFLKTPVTYQPEILNPEHFRAC